MDKKEYILFNMKIYINKALAILNKIETYNTASRNCDDEIEFMKMVIRVSNFAKQIGYLHLKLEYNSFYECKNYIKEIKEVV